MGVCLVGYDLRHKHLSNYQELFAAIKKVSDDNWWHCLDSTWLILHPGPADAIWQVLVPHMHNVADKKIGDKLLVAEVVKDAQWTTSFDEGCHKWLQANLE